LTCTPAVSAVIREGKIHQIYTLMQAGQKFGMQTMNQGLFQAVMQGKIRMEDALSRSPNMQELEQLIAKSPVIARQRGNVTSRAS
jgi:twitching motility protein PilT